MSTAPITYDARGFIINGRRQFLIGGEFHYFRTPCELWEDRLIKMARNGATLVTTYIPWNWHEPREGRERWDGDADLDRFLRLCRQYGLYVIVKPGPYCCAEWDFGGHPDWLLSKNIPLRVLNDAYLEYVRKWYRRVAQVIQPHLITRGGPIVCIQVENEYDHLMEYGEEKITKEDAVRYFTRLADMMNELGVDIPKFANEAAFLRGHPQIIDTRTYYPNIPLFQYWMYMHRYFDGKIRDAKKGQPTCPTMILELQVGWFAQFGRPLYVAPLHLTESVSKSVIALGASVLNYYMYVGGTTFPFWTCRGNIWDILPRGFGTCTTFDFGGSPIREWGEVMPGRMDYIRALSLFVKDFQPLVMESEDSDDLRVLRSAQTILRVTPSGASPDNALQSESENFAVMSRRLGAQYLVCVRNLGAEPKTVDLGFASKPEPLFHNLTLAARQTVLLPVNVAIPNTDTTIEASTSELLFARKIGARTWFGVFGKSDAPGEMRLRTSGELSALEGDVEVVGHALRYIHQGIKAVRVGEDRLLILEQDLCGKVEILQKGLLVTDAYFVREIADEGNRIQLRVQMRNGSRNRFAWFGDACPVEVTANGKPIEVSRGVERAVFVVRQPRRQPVRIEWQGGWRAMGDTAEALPEYSTEGWHRLTRPISLEEAGLLDHGYVWYRAKFHLPDDVAEAYMVYPGNDCDRQRVYVNGAHLWDGITKEQRISLGRAARPGGNVLAVLYANFFHSKSHPHEGAIRKYSGIMQPIVIEGTTRRGAHFREVVSEFDVNEHLTGVRRGYARPDFDDATWGELMPARRYVFDPSMGQIVWLRRKFTYKLSKDWEAGVRFTISQADQRCFIYINGQPVGQFESAGPQYDFYVPAPFLKKENVIALCLEGNGAVLTEPEWGTFYEVKSAVVEIRLSE